MKSKKVFALLAALILLVAAVPCFAEGTDVTSLYKDRDVNAAYDAKDATLIELDQLTEDLVITQKGDYLLSGSLNGQVRIEVGEEDKIRLILNGVTISAQNGPAIYEKLCDKLIVTLAEGSVNSLTAGAPVTDEDDTVGAALYCEDDLSINGSGSLLAVSAQKHGIQSKADLIVAGGSISVQAEGDGIRGRNSVLILDGSISVSAQEDGVTATREDKDGKGWIVIAGGSIDVTTGSGAGAPRASANSQMGRGGWDRWGAQTQTQTQDSVSQKGIKAATSLEIQGGSFSLNCADDALHGVNVIVSGGDFAIKTGDDAIHADEKATISGGNIDIAQCYEGIEGTDVLISGGSISVIASDDAVNAAGGGDQSGMMGGWGMRGGMSQGSGSLTITGGSLMVNASGDGLDSNGDISISGGFIGVWAMTNGGEGTIDFNGSGSFTGGTLIVATTQGRMMDSGALSGQSMLSVSLNKTCSAGTEIALMNANGAVLGAFAPQGSYNTLIVSSDQLKDGDALTIQCGGETVYSGVMSDNASGGDYGMYGQFGGRQGFPGGQQGPWGGNPGWGGQQGGRGR